jgi:hypothetical protein
VKNLEEKQYPCDEKECAFMHEKEKLEKMDAKQNRELEIINRKMNILSNTLNTLQKTVNSMVHDLRNGFKSDIIRQTTEQTKDLIQTVNHLAELITERDNKREALEAQNEGKKIETRKSIWLKVFEVVIVVLSSGGILWTIIVNSTK